MSDIKIKQTPFGPVDLCLQDKVARELAAKGNDILKNALAKASKKLGEEGGEKRSKLCNKQFMAWSTEKINGILAGGDKEATSGAASAAAAAAGGSGVARKSFKKI